MNIFSQNDVAITKIIKAGKLCQPAGYEMYAGEYRNHFPGAPTGYYTITVVLEGEAEYHYSDRVIRTRKDDIIFLGNYSPFYQKSLGDYYTYVINFVAPSGFEDRSDVFHPVNSEKYITMFKEAAAVFEQRTPGYMLMTISSLYKILATLKEDRSDQCYPVSKMDKYIYATDYINMNLSDSQLSVEQVAESLDITSAYLRKIFLETAGMPPLQVIKNMRINYASDLLSTGDMGVAEAAAKCGFQNVSHFCKEFKKIIGCSPLAFKKKHHVTVAPIKNAESRHR